MTKPYEDERTQSLDLKSSMLKIYLQMLKLRRPVDLEEDLFSSYKHEAKYDLEKMVNIGVVNKNPEGKYIIVEDKILDVMLTHFLSINIQNLMRYAFYCSFLFTSLIFYILYILFLPRTDFTTICFTLSIVIFSITIIMIEILQGLRHKALLNNLLKKHSIL